jgi:hypothetical protein
MNTLFTMADMDFYAKLLVDMFRQVLGTIDAAMLSARTTEGEHK